MNRRQQDSPLADPAARRAKAWPAHAGACPRSPRCVLILFVLAVLLGGSLGGANIASDAPKQSPEHVLTLEVFVRSDSEHSQRAEQFARRLAETHRGLRVVVHDVLDNPAARQRFWSLCDKFKAVKPGLPAFFACNRARFGFADAETSGRAIEDLFVIRAFVRAGCTHCRDAKRFLSELQKRWPALRVELFDVSVDSAAQRQMTELANRYGVRVSTLPAIEVFNGMVVGYDTDATTGRHIENLVREASQSGIDVPDQRPHKQSRSPRPSHVFVRAEIGQNAPFAQLRLSRAGEQPGGEVPDDLPPVAEEETTAEAPREPAAPIEGIQLPGWGMLRVRDLGLPAFTFVVGLVDGFNPCAMWVLVFLLSILVNVRSRAKILAIAGTFVVISGLAYFAFMAAWLNVFLLVGYARPLQIALGLMAVLIGLINVKDFVAFKRGLSLSIPEAAKAGIYARVRKIVTAEYLGAAVAMAVVLAIGVNVVELLCTAGLPVVYTQILTLQQLPAWQNYAYLLLYNLAYMLDDSLMLGAFVITLSHRKVQEREGRWLKLASGLVILALGVVMLFRPDWLELAVTSR